jgi:ABC-type transport system involved in multi-copper enzyme maturation permease subunit
VGIRDLGYKPYEGELLPHRNRYRVLISRAMSLAWASGLVKTTIILGMFPAVICGVVMFFKFKTIQILAQNPNVPIRLDDPGSLVFTCIFWCQIWFAFVISLLVAAPAISEDVRTGAFQFYFARPVSKNHYLLGKVAPTALLVLIVSLGPALLLAVLRVGLSQSGGEAWRNLTWVLGTLAYGPVYALVLALPAVALSSLGRRSGSIQGVWAAGFFITWLLGEGIAAGADLPYAALISIPTNLRMVGQLIYGMTPAYDMPWYLPAGVLVALVAGSALLLLRRLERVEVFS